MGKAGLTSGQADRITEAIGALLPKEQAGCSGHIQVEPLNGDGSIRRFWRGQSSEGIKFIAIAPTENADARECAEADAGWQIGTHLRTSGVAVPEIYGFDKRYHLLVYEDLGDIHLYNLITELDFNNEVDIAVARELYRRTIDQLFILQFAGAREFCQQWCWDTAIYDRQLMLERESGYFIRAFWQGVLRLEIPEGLIEEFELLAEIASKIPAKYFLHRDFQSRNVMIKEGGIRIIDFQGGRLGPLAYDLASLLIDPYVSLPAWFQEEQFNYYHQLLEERERIGRKQFRQQYLLLAMQRNLQIIGAFSFLSNVRGKMFFADFIRPAVDSLLGLVREQHELSERLHFKVLEKALADGADILARG